MSVNVMWRAQVFGLHIFYSHDMNIKLRHASIKDLETLLYWDTQPHVIACDPDDDWHWREELKRAPAWREQFIATMDGRDVGMVQIIDPAKEESHYWGKVEKNLKAIDIWIGEATDLNKGYGSKMMKLAISHCFSDPEINGILIDPLVTNNAAIRFYVRLGFRFVEYRYFDQSYCAIMRLDRQHWVFD